MKKIIIIIIFAFTLNTISADNEVIDLIEKEQVFNIAIEDDTDCFSWSIAMVESMEARYGAIDDLEGASLLNFYYGYCHLFLQE